MRIGKNFLTNHIKMPKKGDLCSVTHLLARLVMELICFMKNDMLMKEKQCDANVRVVTHTHSYQLNFGYLTQVTRPRPVLSKSPAFMLTILDYQLKSVLKILKPNSFAIKGKHGN